MTPTFITSAVNPYLQHLTTTHSYSPHAGITNLHHLTTTHLNTICQYHRHAPSHYGTPQTTTTSILDNVFPNHIAYYNYRTIPSPTFPSLSFTSATLTVNCVKIQKVLCCGWKVTTGVVCSKGYVVITPICTSTGMDTPIVGRGTWTQVVLSESEIFTDVNRLTWYQLFGIHWFRDTWTWGMHRTVGCDCSHRGVSVLYLYSTTWCLTLAVYDDII